MTRRAVVPAVIVALAACDSGADTTVVPATVFWMEWPAQVLVATPFTVRLVGTGAECREILKFEAAPAVGDSDVTFEPYFLVTERLVPCPLERVASPAVSVSPIPPFFDTRSAVPALTPPLPRTFAMRAATFAPNADPYPVPKVRMFGDIEVRTDTAGTAITRAGGIAYAYRDTAGCYRLSSFGVWTPYVLENPPDTTSYWNAFVQGYLYTPAAPVCGETRVFHLDSRN